MEYLFPVPVIYGWSVSMYTYKAQRPRLHPFMLAFRATARETAYLHDCAQSLRDQQPIGLLLGALLWVGLDIQDPWSFPEGYGEVWLGRLLTGSVLLLVLTSTFQQRWPRWSTRILVVPVILSAINPNLMMLHGGPELVSHYHQGMFAPFNGLT